MRALSWPAVSWGTLTGSALAITGRPQSRATPAATTVHLRTTCDFTKILARRLLMGQGGQMFHIAQTPNKGTIIALPGTGYVTCKSKSAPLVRRGCAV